MIYLGTAAWNIPRELRSHFPAAASILESYSRRLNAVEINSSFYRHHQAKTYVRWAESVPPDFRFSLKLAKEFTHKARLELDFMDRSLFQRVLRDYQELGEKLGCLLVQLPPGQAWEEGTARRFFDELRRWFRKDIVIEPRHESWLRPEAEELLKEYELSRVWADPAPIQNPGMPELENSNIAYFRLHGSPEIYKSNYEADELKTYQSHLERTAKKATQTWCIFDNTTHGHATANALQLKSQMGSDRD